MIQKSLSEVLEDHPNYQPQWQPLVDDNGNVYGFENPKFGRAEHMVNCDDHGKPLYDQMVIAEGPRNNGVRATTSSAVIIPYFFAGGDPQGDVYLGMVHKYRTTAIDPRTDKKGRGSWDFPRGYAKINEATDATAIRELGEETSKVAMRAVRIGDTKAGINANGPNYETYLSVWMAEVDPTITQKLDRDSNELILASNFFPALHVEQMMIDGGLWDSLSLGAHNIFRASFPKHNNGRRLIL